jgi:plasmid stabilization system protein ParE
MKIQYKESFVIRIERQIRYIAKDNPSAAKHFKKELIAKIKLTSKNPYLFRKSVFFDNETIRDLTFKGYTIVYRINNDYIEVFGFTKYQNSPFD